MPNYSDISYTSDYAGQKTSDGVSRLGLGLETRLETHFFEVSVSVSVSKVSGLVSVLHLVSVSKDFGLGLETLHRLFS